MNEFLPVVVVLFAICISQGSAISCYNCTFDEFDLSDLSLSCTEGSVSSDLLVECPEGIDSCFWTNISLPENRNPTGPDDLGRIGLGIMRGCFDDNQVGCMQTQLGLSCTELCDTDGCNGSVGHLFSLQVILISMATGMLTVLSIK